MIFVQHVYSCLEIILSNGRCVLLNVCRTLEKSRKRKLPVNELIQRSTTSEIKKLIR